MFHSSQTIVNFGHNIFVRDSSMFKKLFLYRHADSVQASKNERDKDRELSSKGISQSHQMGTYLSENFNLPEIIFSSTAIRAIQTATITGETFKIDTSRIVEEEELYNASVRTLLEFICRIDDAYNTVMCVGHNPAITYLAEYITAEAIGDLSPAGIVVIDFDLAKWAEVSQGNGKFVRYMTPESISKS